MYLEFEFDGLRMTFKQTYKVTKTRFTTLWIFVSGCHYARVLKTQNQKMLNVHQSSSKIITNGV